MDLVRDLLDKPLRDRNGVEMGRVDGVVLEVQDGEPPRVIAIEIGPAVLAHRLRPSMVRRVEAAEIALGVNANRPTRIAVSDVQVDETITVSVAISDTGAGNVERALRRLLRW